MTIVTFFVLFVLSFCALYLVSLGKILEKAGMNGWFVLVPIYNLILFCKVAKMSTVETVLMFIPPISVIMWAIFSFKLAKAFGKSDVFGAGLWLLGCVFYPVLAFGDSEYVI